MYRDLFLKYDLSDNPFKHFLSSLIAHCSKGKEVMPTSLDGENTQQSPPTRKWLSKKIGINQLLLCFLLNRGIPRKIEIKPNIKEQKAPFNETEIVP
jgi:hypothetical protein